VTSVAGGSASTPTFSSDIISSTGVAVGTLIVSATDSAATSKSPDAFEFHSGPLTLGAKIGLIAGGVGLLLALAGCIAACCWWKKRKSRRPAAIVPTRPSMRPSKSNSRLQSSYGGSTVSGHFELPTPSGNATPQLPYSQQIYSGYSTPSTTAPPYSVLGQPKPVLYTNNHRRKSSNGNLVELA
jgi:hypothetical protein